MRKKRAISEALSHRPSAASFACGVSVQGSPRRWPEARNSSIRGPGTKPARGMFKGCRIARRT